MKGFLETRLKYGIFFGFLSGIIVFFIVLNSLKMFYSVGILLGIVIVCALLGYLLKVKITKVFYLFWHLFKKELMRNLWDLLGTGHCCFRIISLHDEFIISKFLRFFVLNGLF